MTLNYFLLPFDNTEYNSIYFFGIPFCGSLFFAHLSVPYYNILPP